MRIRSKVRVSGQREKGRCMMMWYGRTLRERFSEFASATSSNSRYERAIHHSHPHHQFTSVCFPIINENSLIMSKSNSSLSQSFQQLQQASDKGDPSLGGKITAMKVSERDVIEWNGHPGIVASL